MHLPLDFADDHFVSQIEHALFVETSVINRVVVTLGKELDDAIGGDLLGGDSVDDWDVFSFNLVHNDVPVLDGCVVRQNQDVSPLHFWLHRAGQDHDDGALSPEAQLHYVPDHDSTGDYQSELESLVDQLQGISVRTD